MAPTNTAAYYPSDKAPTLELSSAPYPNPGPNEIIIKVAATAINPVDKKIQEAGTALFPFLTYPLVGGLDVSGTIVEVGPSTPTSTSSVSSPKFSPGDRVLGFPCDFTSRTGGFQTYVAVPTSLVSAIPPRISYAEAATLPSGIATAAEALYNYLRLTPPTSPPRPRNGKTVLIGGGASVVGSNAIQLAVASGYEVITTSSPANFQHCKSLGASLAYDYRDPDLVSKLVSAFTFTDPAHPRRELAGSFSAVEGSNAPLFQTVQAVKSASESQSQDQAQASNSVACAILFNPDNVPEGVTAEMIHAYHIKETPLAEAIYGIFLPAALASREYKIAPRPRVVGHGLEALQTGLDIIGEGVSCQKLVVTLGEEE